MTNRILFAAMGSSAMILSAPAIAASPEEQLLESFQECASIQDDVARLTCYDNTLASARTSVAAQREEQQQRQEEDFGLSGLELDRRDRQEAPERVAKRAEADPDEISATLSDVFVSPRTKKRLFLLNNGQIWAETTRGTLSRTPRLGSAVTVSKSSFGGFKLSVEGRNGFAKVKRSK